MKIVINSNINYSRPVKTLFKSLVDIGFDRIENDVVLVVSQSEVQKPPKKNNLREVFADAPDLEVCVIGMEMNNFDYSGYHALHLYGDDPLVKDDSYLYVLDTSTFDESFKDKYSDISPGKSCVKTCWRPHSNICAFGSEVVKNYGDNFSTILTKKEAIELEWGETITKNGRVVKGILEFGEFVHAGERLSLETQDIYETSYPRVRFHYPFFGISKWILWGINGDMTGEIRPNMI